MTNLNFLSKSGSQSRSHSIVTLCTTVGSPSVHRRSTMLKLLAVFVLVLTFGVGQMWGADVITPVSGSQYRFKATYSSTNYYMVAPTPPTNNASQKPTTTTTEANGTIFTFTKENNSWYITYNYNNTTYYVYESGTNAEVTISSTKHAVNTVTTNNSFTKIGGTKWIQFNYNNGSPRMGCYSSATGVVLSEAEAATPRTVSWKCNGSAWTSGVVTGNTTVASGSKISAVPTAPTSSNCDNSKVFVGWTATENYSHASIAPTDLFTDVTGSPTITANITFYAVFANSEDSESTTTFTFNGSTLGTGGYKDTDFEWMGLDFKRSQMYYNNSGAQVAKTNNGFWNVEAFPGAIKQIKVTATQNNATLYTGTTAKATTSSNTISTGQERTFNISTNNNYRYFYIKSGSAYTVITTLKVTYVAPSYSNYETACCTSLGSINGSFLGDHPFGCPES